MGWIEILNEPLTKLDILYGVIGYLIYKWLLLFLEVGKKIYKNIKDEKS